MAKTAFQKGLENRRKSGKSQWKVREFWKGYWVAALYFLNAKIMYVYDSLTLPKFSAELLGFQEKPFVCIFTLLSKK